MTRIKAGLGAIAMSLVFASLAPCQDVLPVQLESTAPPGAVSALPLMATPASAVPMAAPAGSAPLMATPAGAVTDHGCADTFMPQTQRARHWHKYDSCACDAPIGLDGPILMEIYLQNGVNQPIAGGFLNTRLAAGWIIQGGGRSLFFNPAVDRAWTVDVSIANITNNGNQPNLTFPFQNGTASVRNLNRTYVSLGAGRERYLLGNGLPEGNGQPQGCAWRVGYDLGGRYGSARLGLNTTTTTSGFARTNDNFGALYVAAHSDIEKPCGFCTFIGGFRLEWDYQWLDDIGVTQPDNLSNLNMLVNVGVRY